jgi:hypothetical protein
MSFEYACFISYRNGKKVDDTPVDDLLNTFANQVFDALESELNAYLDFDDLVFLDIKKLNPGEFIIPVISKALNKSVCMILIYTPNYFSENKMYCSCECKGMLDIEIKRKSLLSIDPTIGLIITIVLRGVKQLPDYLRKRIWFDFTPYDMSVKEEIKKHPKFNSSIKEIAEQIYNIHQVLKHKINQMHINIFENHDEFLLLDPNNDDQKREIQAFIETIKSNRIKEMYPDM